MSFGEGKLRVARSELSTMCSELDVVLLEKWSSGAVCRLSGDVLLEEIGQRYTFKTWCCAFGRNP